MNREENGPVQRVFEAFCLHSDSRSENEKPTVDNLVCPFADPFRDPRPTKRGCRARRPIRAPSLRAPERAHGTAAFDRSIAAGARASRGCGSCTTPSSSSVLKCMKRGMAQDGSGKRKVGVDTVGDLRDSSRYGPRTPLAGAPARGTGEGSGRVHSPVDLEALFKGPMRIIPGSMPHLNKHGAMSREEMEEWRKQQRPWIDDAPMTRLGEAVVGSMPQEQASKILANLEEANAARKERILQNEKHVVYVGAVALLVNRSHEWFGMSYIMCSRYTGIGAAFDGQMVQVRVQNVPYFPYVSEYRGPFMCPHCLIPEQGDVPFNVFFVRSGKFKIV